MSDISGDAFLPEGVAIEPDLPIIDSHHHLWLHPNNRYLIDEFQADLASGHKVLSTIFAECSAMYRTTGPEKFKPVGEAEFVAGVAAMSASGLFGPTRMCAAFVGWADLTLGDAVDEVLEALDVASGGRFRGVRGVTNWDSDPAIHIGSRPMAPQGLLADPTYRAGVSCLARRGLVYDSLQFHPQLAEVANFADAFPNMPIVVNHCGGLVGIGRYARPERFSEWKALIVNLAKRPNVLMKLGGLSTPRCGFEFHKKSTKPTSADLVTEWRPYIETCIELFGADRCMFESNFPPDRAGGSYCTIWNVFKFMASGCSASEKHALFSGNARRVYRID